MIWGFGALRILALGLLEQNRSRLHEAKRIFQGVSWLHACFSDFRCRGVSFSGSCHLRSDSVAVTASWMLRVVRTAQNPVQNRVAGASK